MPAPKVRVKIADLKELTQTRDILKLLAKDDKISRYGLKRLIKLHAHLTAQAFEEQRDPDTGKPWPGASTDTKKDKRFSGRLLERSGSLVAAAIKASSGAKPHSENGVVTAVIQFPAEPKYGPYHQYGTAGSSRTGGGRGIQAVFVNHKQKKVQTVYGVSTGLPARPFFAFASDFTNNNVNKEISQTFKVVFEAYHNALYKKAIELPAEEIEGYETIISFTSASGRKASGGRKMMPNENLTHTHLKSAPSQFHGERGTVHPFVTDHLKPEGEGWEHTDSWKKELKRRSKQASELAKKKKEHTGGRKKAEGSRRSLREARRKEYTHELEHQTKLQAPERTRIMNEANSPEGHARARANFNREREAMLLELKALESQRKVLRPDEYELARQEIRRRYGNIVITKEGKFDPTASAERYRLHELGQKMNELDRKAQTAAAKATGWNKRGPKPVKTAAEKAADKEARIKERQRKAEEKKRHAEQLQKSRELKAVPVVEEVIKKLYMTARSGEEAEKYLKLAEKTLSKSTLKKAPEALELHRQYFEEKKHQLSERARRKAEQAAKMQEQRSRTKRDATKNEGETKEAPKKPRKSSEAKPKIETTEERQRREAIEHNAPITAEIERIKAQRQALKDAGNLSKEQDLSSKARIEELKGQLKQYTTKTVYQEPERTPKPKRTTVAAKPATPPPEPTMNTAQAARAEQFKRQVNRLKKGRSRLTASINKNKRLADQAIRETKNPFGGNEHLKKANDLIDLRNRLDDRLDRVQKEFLALKPKAPRVAAAPSPDKPRGVRTRITTTPRNKE